MNGMFDVDCPRTPDGEGDDNGNNASNNANNNAKPKPPSSSRPPRSSSAAAAAMSRVGRTKTKTTNTNSNNNNSNSTTPRSNSRKQQRTPSFSPRIGGNHRKSSASASAQPFSPRMQRSARKQQQQQQQQQKQTTLSNNMGLEPEEYIAPGPPPPSMMRSPLPPRAPSSGPSKLQLQQLQQQQSIGAPASGNNGGRIRTHSTEAFGNNDGNNNNNNNGSSTNPFDDGNDAKMNGGAGGNRGRTGSGNWWKEEIVEEGDDKGVAMDKYYGLNQREAQELYGGPTAADQPPRPTNAGNAMADVEQGGGVAHHDRRVHGGQAFQNVNNNNNPPNSGNPSIGNNLDSSIYQQAASSNNAGYYNNNNNTNNNTATVDDYSFSNINLSSPGNSLPPSRGTSPVNNNKSSSTNHLGNFLLRFKWISNALKKDDATDGYQHPNLPPNMTPATNIAPRSPTVTFTNDFNPDSFNFNTSKKRKDPWNNLSPARKLAAGLVMVALVCTIFGVTVSNLKKKNARNIVPGGGDGGGYGRDQAQGMDGSLPQLAPPAPGAHDDSSRTPTGWPETPRPTPAPTTGNPTRAPATPRPTTQGNIAGYSAMHGKDSGGTGMPTRDPVTAPPATASPTKKPTGSPTTASPTKRPTAAPAVVVEAVQSAQEVGGAATTAGVVDCNDRSGLFLNHLSNPKDCAWLAKVAGHSDRKDKNCGGRTVQAVGGEIVYSTTELGRNCQRACGLYNGCDTAQVEAAVELVIMSSSASSSAGVGAGAGSSSSHTGKKKCNKNQEGMFKNHLLNDKTCDWLYNDKAGKTDRKDKNCGFANYPKTELGKACPESCDGDDYNANDDDCDNEADDAAAAGELTISNGLILRSFSSPNYSYSLTSPSSSSSSSSVGLTTAPASCVDGDGEYLDHKKMLKSCSWLLGGGGDLHLEAEHRQVKNCGSDYHDITELGTKCPSSCKEYNECT